METRQRGFCCDFRGKRENDQWSGCGQGGEEGPSVGRRQNLLHSDRGWHIYSGEEEPEWQLRPKALFRGKTDSWCHR